VAPAPAASLDRQRVERWTATILTGDTAPLRETFAAAGARGPGLRWRPAPESLAAPQHRFLLRYWSDLRGERPLPHLRQIDAIEMRPALGYVNLLETLGGGDDFRYRVFGSVVAAVSGFDLTGHLASRLWASPYIVEFALAALRAVHRRGEPLFTEHGPPTTEYTSTWHRLVLPFGDDRGAIARLLVGMVPMTQDGRPAGLRL